MAEPESRSIEVASAAAHVPGCAACTSYVQQLKAERARFLAARPKEMFLAQVDRRASTKMSTQGRKSLYRFVGLGAGALAVALVFVSRPGQHAVEFKGSLMAIHRLRAGAEIVLSPSSPEPLHTGDALRFVIRSDRPGYAAVFERDAAGNITVVAPFAAVAPALISAGSTALPDSAILDAASGSESFTAVFSEQPFDIARVSQQLSAKADAASLDCAQCTLDVERFEKQP